MVIFESEAHMVESFNHHDELIRQCALGHLSFAEFCTEYRDFYAFYALDGHESDEEERTLLERYKERVEVHRVVFEDILGGVCSDADAQLESYQRAGRFGSAEAVRRLRDLAAVHL